MTPGSPIGSKSTQYSQRLPEEPFMIGGRCKICLCTVQSLYVVRNLTSPLTNPQHPFDTPLTPQLHP